MTGRLEGKVAFVTGAARGQGRCHAVRLAEEGADIIAIDIAATVEHVPYPGATPEDLKETSNQVEALGRRLVTAQADVRDLDALKEIVSRGAKELGRLDIVVANAGIDIPGRWDEQTPEIVRTTIDINLIGIWNTVMAAAPLLIESGGGSIVLISSSNGLKAGPYNIAYNMAKFGVTGMARSFAMEMAKDGVRVNSVHPGAVDTAMAHGALATFQRIPGEDPNLSGMIAAWKPGLMPPQEVSHAVVWLASDESSWVTGHALAVDGGAAQY